MNLITDAWIPALRSDGSRSLFGLHDLFAEAHRLRDLAVKPHERVALMRLLCCISHAAIDGPGDEEAWLACRKAIQPQVDTYLQKWKTAFELFGTGARFLQLPNVEPSRASDEGNSSTKLDLALATGNNPSLFDNGAGDARRISPARAALNLLTFQCFSPSGRIGVARWNGRDTQGKGSSKHAPCSPSSMLHALVIGSSLLDTIVSNLLTKELVGANVARGWGCPVWEKPVQSLEDSAAVENATLTFLGRLLPLSRAIRLDETGESIVLGNGLEYPSFPEYREATATIIVRKEGPGLLAARTGRAFWRQLHAIAVKRQADATTTAGALALGLNAFGKDSALWVGAFVTDKAKIEDVLESSYIVPPALFEPFGRAAYESGIRYADDGETALKRAISAYATALKVDRPPDDNACRHFWTRIEQCLGDLFTVTRELTPPELLAASPWGRAVRKSAFEAYETSCPRRTSRQIQAYALGLRFLHGFPKSSKPAKTKISPE